MPCPFDMTSDHAFSTASIEFHPRTLHAKFSTADPSHQPVSHQLLLEATGCAKCLMPRHLDGLRISSEPFSFASGTVSSNVKVFNLLFGIFNVSVNALSHEATAHPL